MTDNNCEDERWLAHRREHELENELMTTRANALDNALVLAREEVNRRLEGMNELRAQITSERGVYIARAEYEAKHEALAIRSDLNLARIVAIETQNAALASRLAVYATIAGFVMSAIVVVALKVVNL